MRELRLRERRRDGRVLIHSTPRAVRSSGISAWLRPGLGTVEQPGQLFVSQTCKGDATLLGKVVWGLMTARPDELDSDVKSRAPLQIPIFDLEGDARGVFVRELFARRGVQLADPELRTVLDRTELYSSRDYNFLVRQVLAKRNPVAEVLNVWQASSSIVAQRRFQSLIAAQHCSYPQLTPDWIKRLGPEAVQAEVERLRWSLQK